jgi:STE24 endopeptidase
LFVYLWITYIITAAAVEPLGFGSMSNIAALPLLVLVFSAVNMIFTPFTNTCIRRFEKAADGYALQLTENPQAFVSMMAKLTDQNLAEAEPSRWVELLFHDHPSYNNRLEYARKYFELKQGGN